MSVLRAKSNLFLTIGGKSISGNKIDADIYNTIRNYYLCFGTSSNTVIKRELIIAINDTLHSLDCTMWDFCIHAVNSGFSDIFRILNELEILPCYGIYGAEFNKLSYNDDDNGNDEI